MDSQFSPRIKDIIGYSREEAIRLGNDYIGQEHLILGILSDGEGIATDVLEQLGLNLAEIKRLIEKKVYKRAELLCKPVLTIISGTIYQMFIRRKSGSVQALGQSLSVSFTVIAGL